jgi:4-amino-4-deoxy-L-arabinose transferase-like glycosyltransferase
MLQSWIIALLGLAFGEVSQVAARIPTVAAVFAATLLLVSLLRPYLGRRGALVGGAAFLVSPAVLQKIVTAEPDILLTASEFAAFFIWWRGRQTGRARLLQWIAIGLLLAATALFKGPQPAAFFALGVGTFIVIRREWRDLAGFMLAGVISLGLLVIWYARAVSLENTDMVLGYMRLRATMGLDAYLRQRLSFAGIVVQFLPATLVLIPAVALRLWRTVEDPRQGELLLALTLFVAPALIVLALWPGANIRYALPALPAVVAIAALLFGPLASRFRLAARATLGVLAALSAYQLAWNLVVAPLAPDAFAKSRIDARILAAAAPDPGKPVLAVLRIADPVLAYLDRPVRYLPDLSQVTAPSYLLAFRGEAEELDAARPDIALVFHAGISFHDLSLYEVIPQPYSHADRRR